MLVRQKVSGLLTALSTLTLSCKTTFEPHPAETATSTARRVDDDCCKGLKEKPSLEVSGPTPNPYTVFSAIYNNWTGTVTFDNSQTATICSLKENESGTPITEALLAVGAE